MKINQDEILKRQRIELENIDLKKENEELKHQLAEKDEEIEELKQANKFLSSDKVVSEEQCKQIAKEAQQKLFKENILIIQKKICKQVCDEIRGTIKYFQQQVPVWLIMEKLDQIERGEKE